MDRVPRAMSLIHDLVMKLEALWNHKAVLEPYNSIGILSEALSFTQLYPLADGTHSNVHSLSSDDVFFDGWMRAMLFNLPCGTTQRLSSSGSQQEG
jgi:hypothetical protein